jgi:aspartate aminotransferase
MVAQSIREKLERASWIRRMFEEGARLRQERGADNVFDFTLGNPDVEPPAPVIEALRRAVASDRPGSHGYMPNAGLLETRTAVADKLRQDTGLAFSPADIVMTVGSAGACNVILKTILDPGDEVIVLLPFFSEYEFYIGNHGGKMVPVESGEDFLPNIAAIAAAITDRTRAILLNTPNNPTGRVYPAATLGELQELLARCDHEILVISDEPYTSLVYDGKKQTPVAAAITNTVICTSWSKSQALAGERIGYLALSPRLHDLPTLRSACTFANRVLGFVNAPALWQRVVAQNPTVSVDVAGYQEKRDRLCDGLAAVGYDLRKPEGAFYVFCKTPVSAAAPDDIAFIQKLAEQGVLAVPGTGFGRSGYMRLTLTVPLVTIERALPLFERVFRSLGSSSS